MSLKLSCLDHVPAVLAVKGSDQAIEVVRSVG